MLPGREEPASPGTPLKRRSFATTHWSVVLATRDAQTDRARQALERHCGEEVAHTVDDPEEIEDELNHLLRVLGQ